MHTTPDLYFSNQKNWQPEQNALREIVLECGLTENIKWKHPCYTNQNKNIVMVHGFKDYCALFFFKGALLKDSREILIQQTANVLLGRQIRFSQISEIEKLEKIIKEYIFEAIDIEKQGIQLKNTISKNQNLPVELENIFTKNMKLKIVFEKLTPGRQRGYLLHFSSATQSKTITARIENCTQKILNGFGFNDCTCGLSKRMPNCDGSHKILKTKPI